MKLFFVLVPVLVIGFTISTCIKAQEVPPAPAAVSDTQKQIDAAVAKALAAQKAQPAQPTNEQIKQTYKQLFDRVKSAENVFVVACKESGGKEILVSVTNGQATLICPVPVK